jgi:hypothetical protein
VVDDGWPDGPVAALAGRLASRRRGLGQIEGHKSGDDPPWMWRQTRQFARLRSIRKGWPLGPTPIRQFAASGLCGVVVLFAVP